MEHHVSCRVSAVQQAVDGVTSQAKIQGSEVAIPPDCRRSPVMGMFEGMVCVISAIIFLYLIVIVADSNQKP